MGQSERETVVAAERVREPTYLLYPACLAIMHEHDPVFLCVRAPVLVATNKLSYWHLYGSARVGATH